LIKLYINDIICNKNMKAKKTITISILLRVTEDLYKRIESYKFENGVFKILKERK